jgi:hypothetical protein
MKIATMQGIGIQYGQMGYPLAILPEAIAIRSPFLHQAMDKE